MAFILSTSTTVSSPFQNAISVNTGAGFQQQILYQLSSVDPVYDVIIQAQETVNISIYAPGPGYNTQSSLNCEPANSISLSVDPGFCGSPVQGASINGNFYVSNYTYSKNRDTYGIETWSLIAAPKFMDANLNVLYESIFLRGVALGSSTDGETGVSFAQTVPGEHVSINVSAGFPGVGQANTAHYGIVASVGGGAGAGPSDGQASVNIPYTSIYNEGGTNTRVLT